MAPRERDRATPQTWRPRMTRPRPEHALLSLRTALHPEWKPFFEQIGFEPMSFETAMADPALFALNDLERLRVVHHVVRLNRVDDFRAAAQELTRGVIREESFDRMIAMSGNERRHLGFEEFVKSLADADILLPTLGVSMRVYAPDECTDQRTQDGGPVRIRASFQADGNPHDFAHGANPLNWPGCNPFFISITPQGSLRALPPPDNVLGTAYEGLIKEVVGIPNVWTPTTDLNVRYFVAQDAVGMEFSFAGGDGRIDVDHGFVLVEKDPSELNKVNISSQKTVRFVGISNFPATLACELGWIHVMRNMATCPPSRVSQRAAPATDPAPPDDGVTSVSALVEQLLEVATSSVERTGNQALEAWNQISRGQYDPKDAVRDAAQFWGEAAKDVASGFVILRDYLDRVAEERESEGPV